MNLMHIIRMQNSPMTLCGMQRALYVLELLLCPSRCYFTLSLIFKCASLVMSAEVYTGTFFIPCSLRLSIIWKFSMSLDLNTSARCESVCDFTSIA